MSTAANTAQPWLAQYAKDRPQAITVEFDDALAMFRAAVARAADKPAIKYFDGTLTYREVDELSDALAVGLQEHGFVPGDRLALFLQNVPHFIIGELAAWKAGGIAVSINPMNKGRELNLLLKDSGAKAILLHGYLYRDVAKEVLADFGSPVLAIVASEREFQTRNDTRVLPKDETGKLEGTVAFTDLVTANRGKKPSQNYTYGKDDIALIVYTSGTTGLPKGAMNTHGNLGYTAQVYRDWMSEDEGGGVYALAPLFHITGLIGHIALAQINAAPLGLTFRFEPSVTLQAFREYKPVFTIGAITAFIALMHAPDAKREDMASVKRLYSGGAAIPPSVVNQFVDKFGLTIYNAYGLTETTSPSTACPQGVDSPVDPTSGSLSIGVPVYDTHVEIIGDDGNPAAVGEVGEIAVRGPQVVKGYWQKPEETERSLPGGRLNTGDVGFMDANGFFFIVDRKKDMINAAGYKVWPREVEDVLYTHPAIREAAVVGIPDDYRGENVKAVVSFKPGMSAEPEELVAFCRTRMAAYKVPRVITSMDELPKTPTGKILRRLLREQTPAPA